MSFLSCLVTMHACVLWVFISTGPVSVLLPSSSDLSLIVLYMYWPHGQLSISPTFLERPNVPRLSSWLYYSSSFISFSSSVGCWPWWGFMEMLLNFLVILDCRFRPWVDMSNLPLNRMTTGKSDFDMPKFLTVLDYLVLFKMEICNFFNDSTSF